MDYLGKHKLLVKEHHGFLAGKSINTTGAEFIDSIIKSVEKVLGVIFDLTRAFESVFHPTLLKYWDCGIKGT